MKPNYLYRPTQVGDILSSIVENKTYIQTDNGLVEADGRLIRKDYCPILYGVIGDYYGTEDTLRFRIPDYRCLL